MDVRKLKLASELLIEIEGLFNEHFSDGKMRKFEVRIECYCERE